MKFEFDTLKPIPFTQTLHYKELVYMGEDKFVPLVRQTLESIQAETSR